MDAYGWDVVGSLAGVVGVLVAIIFGVLPYWHRARRDEDAKLRSYTPPAGPTATASRRSRSNAGFGSRRILERTVTTAALVLILLINVCILAAFGWIFGGHGIHFLGSVKAINIFGFWCSLIVIVLFSCIEVFILDEDHFETIPVVVFWVLAGSAAASGIFHVGAPQEASKFLGIEHGSQLVCDWLSWRF